MSGPIELEDIAHVRFEAPDLDVVEDFYHDFGLTTAERDAEALYLAAGDGRVVHITQIAAAARFVGVGFRATSPESRTSASAIHSSMAFITSLGMLTFSRKTVSRACSCANRPLATPSTCHCG